VHQRLLLQQPHASSGAACAAKNVTAKGKAMTDRVNAARERLGRVVFESWDAHDIDDLVRLVVEFADAVKDEPNQ
jgi:hypothetical protein